MIMGAIFFGVLLLNRLNYPFLGDDYVYAFMWQGQDIFTPLPEDARRIQSFSDIFHSLYSHYFTWGGRMVAHFFVMLFMWVGKFWFDIANSFMVVLLMLEMQWIAHEGRITMDIRSGHVALAFFAFGLLISTGAIPLFGCLGPAITCGQWYSFSCFLSPISAIILLMER